MKKKTDASYYLGKLEMFYCLEEANCYKSDLPNFNLHTLDCGHMVLLTYFEETSTLIHKFCSVVTGT
ncbi:hypothetical protein [Dyadobacter luteus]|nr:hypothetical protein [Dyadobacter luteus]